MKLIYFPPRIFLEVFLKLSDSERISAWELVYSIAETSPNSLSALSQRIPNHDMLNMERTLYIVKDSQNS